MIRTLAHMGVCVGEVLLVRSKAIVEDISLWTVLCVGASVVATAWAMADAHRRKAMHGATQWRQFDMDVQPCRVAK